MDFLSTHSTPVSHVSLILLDVCLVTIVPNATNVRKGTISLLIRFARPVQSNVYHVIITPVLLADLGIYSIMSIHVYFVKNILKDASYAYLTQHASNVSKDIIYRVIFA
jgi:hypothetical protein